MVDRIVATVALTVITVLAVGGCGHPPTAARLAEPVALKGPGHSASPEGSPSASPVTSPTRSPETNWYSVGQEFAAAAAHDGLTPAYLENQPGRQWDAAQPAESWCADLVYPKPGTLPASLQATLAEVQQAPQALTPFDDGCLNGYGLAFGSSSPSAPAGEPAQPAPASQSPTPLPAGLQADGQLETGCAVTRTNGSGGPVTGADLTLYNPGSSPVYVTYVGVEWNDGQVTSNVPYGNSIAPGQVRQVPLGLTVSAVAATACTAGWS